MAGKKALIVIDMQNDYLWDKRMKKFSYDTEKLTAEVNKSIVEFAANGDDVIYIAQMFPNIITNKWFIGFSIKSLILDVRRCIFEVSTISAATSLTH